MQFIWSTVFFKFTDGDGHTDTVRLPDNCCTKIRLCAFAKDIVSLGSDAINLAIFGRFFYLNIF